MPQPGIEQTESPGRAAAAAEAAFLREQNAALQADVERMERDCRELREALRESDEMLVDAEAEAGELAYWREKAIDVIRYLWDDRDLLDRIAERRAGLLEVCHRCFGHYQAASVKAHRLLNAALTKLQKEAGL